MSKIEKDDLNKQTLSMSLTLAIVNTKPIILGDNCSLWNEACQKLNKVNISYSLIRRKRSKTWQFHCKLTKVMLFLLFPPFLIGDRQIIQGQVVSKH